VTQLLSKRRLAGKFYRRGTVQFQRFRGKGVSDIKVLGKQEKVICQRQVKRKKTSCDKKKSREKLQKGEGGGEILEDVKIESAKIDVEAQKTKISSRREIF